MEKEENKVPPQTENKDKKEDKTPHSSQNMGK
jgi:hypothetical protein